MIEYSEWTYFVQLDGDFALECPSLEYAMNARLMERGHIPVKDRKIWRERTEWEDIPMSDPTARMNL